MDVSNLSERGKEVKDFPNFMAENAARVLRNLYHESNNPKGYVNFGVAETSLCEDILAEKLSEPEMNRYEAYMQYYFDVRGVKSFRVALGHFLSKKLRSTRPIDPEGLVVTVGASASIDLLAQLFFDQGDRCLILAPYYGVITSDLGIRAKVKTLPTELSCKPQDGGPAFAPNIKDMEATLLEAHKKGERVRGLLLMNPHNPTGDMLTRPQLMEILQFAHRFDLHVMVDEIYALSTLTEEDEFISVLSLEDNPCPEKTHLIWGFSKDFGLSGFRCGIIHTHDKGFVTASEHLLLLSSVPSIVQEKLRRLITDEEWLETIYFAENKKRMRVSHDYAVGRLRNLGALIHPPKAGFFIWANLHQFMTTPDSEGELMLFESFLQAGVYCLPGTALFYGEPGWFRFTFTLPVQTLKQGFDRLQTLLTQVKTG